MRKRHFFILSFAVIVVTLLVFIGCGGGSSGSSGGTSPTNNPTSTSAPYSNDYKVLASSKGVKASIGILIILPVSAKDPYGFSPAGGSYISFTNGQGVQVTTQVNANGQFNAQELGIPGINGPSGIDNVANVDVSYNGIDETNIPLPVFETGVPSDPGQVIAVKVIPGAGMIKAGAELAFFCLGITDKGYVIPLKDVSWEVGDESVIKIKETAEDKSICVVEGIQGGEFPAPAFADLKATFNGGVLPTATATVEPEPTAEVDAAKTELTDTVQVGVISVPEMDGIITGRLLDQNGQPIADARLVFRSAEVAEDSKFGNNFFLAFPSWTDEQGQFTAEVMSGQTYTVRAMVNEDLPIPTPTFTILPTPEEGTLNRADRFNGKFPAFMQVYSTTPASFGPVASGETSQDFTLGDPVNPYPTPFPTHTWSPFPTPTHTWSPHPSPTHTWSPFPFPTMSWTPPGN
jgi:hypothetical protein